MISIHHLRIAAIILLVFNGIGALYGGGNLIADPDGSSLGISTEFLRYTPFPDFLIPGIVLFVVNGVLSLIVAALTLLKKSRYPILIIGEGMLLSGWIIVQIFLLRTVNFLHITMGSVGLLLLTIGYVLNSKADKRSVNG